MAASVMRCRRCITRQIYLPFTRTYAIDTDPYRKTYYVLLPQVPPDTPATNSLLRTHELPTYNTITPRNVVSGCAKLALDYEVQLGKHLDQLEDANFLRTVESVLEPIEKWQVPTQFALCIAENLFYALGNEDYGHIYQRVSPQSQTAIEERWRSEPLYRAVQELDAGRANLNEYQARLVHYYRLKGRLRGLELTGLAQETMYSHELQIQKLCATFSNSLNVSHHLFKHTIVNYGQVAELPKSLVHKMAVHSDVPGRGPWEVTLENNIYEPFMKHCHHRMMRWHAWKAKVGRASTLFSDSYLSNHMHIDSLREHRHDTAELLGYKTFADMSMETKMAGSVDTVLNFIETLKSHFYPRLEEDLGELQELMAIVEGPKADLELWDLPYWISRHRGETFESYTNPLFFTYDGVLNGVFHWCKLLFGVQFKNVSSSVETWDPHVSCYSITDSASGEERAFVYIDPYTRPPKLQHFAVKCIRSRSDIVGSKPMSIVYLNLEPPISRSFANHVSVNEAGRIFYEFGDVLQQCLTDVPYSDLAGQNNIEADALHTCANVMEMIFYQPAVLKTVVSADNREEDITDVAIIDLLKQSRHMQYYDLLHELYLSAFDMQMCMGTDYWRDHMQKLWPQFIPLTLHREDEHPCSLRDIIIGEKNGCYYSELWSKMLAADIISTMKQTDFEDPEMIAKFGRRFRDTYLSLGGGVSAGDVFRRFQGRDPSIEPLISYLEFTGES